MEEGATSMLKQAEDKLQRKVNAELAKLQEIIDRNPLPETMEISIVVFFKTPDVTEIGLLHLRRVMDTKMTVKPTTTVGEIKEFVLGIMPILEVHQIGIEYQGENLHDIITVQQINYRWPFMNDKTLDLFISYRSPIYKGLYKYFIDMGKSQEIAKKQTETIMELMDKGVDRTKEKTEDFKFDVAGYSEVIELFPMFLP